MSPKVSIIIANYNYPHLITRLLKSMQMVTGISYEVVVVDNGSESEVVQTLETFEEKRWIHTLVKEPINNWLSEGNNIGVRNADPDSEYILFLNADTEILHPLWLLRMVEWMEGTAKILPYTWSDKFVPPANVKRDIIAIGLSFDSKVPGCARPEGWCLMFRREFCGEISPDFPIYYGTEEMTAGAIRDGARCGILCQYSKYIRHYERGCESHLREEEIINKRSPDIRGWFEGLPRSDTLDFTYGEFERRSYGEW